MAVPSLSSATHAREVPGAVKFSIRKVRQGAVGDVMFIFGFLNVSGAVLKEIPLLKQYGEALDKLQPGQLVNKFFACGTKKELIKHS